MGDEKVRTEDAAGRHAFVGRSVLMAGAMNKTGRGTGTNVSPKAGSKLAAKDTRRRDAIDYFRSTGRNRGRGK